MSRYIDADKIEFHATPHEWKFREYVAIQSEVEAIQVEDVELIRHGKWTFNANNGHPYAHCSSCDRKMSTTLYGYAYCPRCGAKMDGDKTDEN